MLLPRANALVNSVLQLHARSPLRQTEIERVTGLTLRGVQQALLALGKQGAVVRFEQNGIILYAPVRDGLVGKALRALAIEAINWEQLLAPQLARIRALALIGSFAKGCETPTSDLGLLVVGRADKEELLEVMDINANLQP